MRPIYDIIGANVWLLIIDISRLDHLTLLDNHRWPSGGPVNVSMLGSAQIHQQFAARMKQIQAHEAT